MPELFVVDKKLPKKLPTVIQQSDFSDGYYKKPCKVSLMYYVSYHKSLFRTFAEKAGVSNPLPFLFFCHSRRPISQIIITKLWRVDGKGWQKILTNGSKVVAKEFEQRLLYVREGDDRNEKSCCSEVLCIYL